MPKTTSVKYAVFSSLPDEQEVLEVTRTERDVAEQDVSIFQSILRRSARVVEVQS